MIIPVTAGIIAAAGSGPNPPNPGQVVVNGGGDVLLTWSVGTAGSIPTDLNNPSAWTMDNPTPTQVKLTADVTGSQPSLDVSQVGASVTVISVDFGNDDSAPDAGDGTAANFTLDFSTWTGGG